MTTGRTNRHLPDAHRPAIASGPGGFTLLELILVLFLIGAILAISAPSLRGFFQSRQTADAAARVAALAQWAHSQAIARGQRCRLNIDPQAGTCWVSVQRRAGFEAADGEEGLPFPFPEGSQVTLKLASGEGPPYVQFHPSGRADVATIEFRGREGEVFLVANGTPTEPYRVLSTAETFK